MECPHDHVYKFHDELHHVPVFGCLECIKISVPRCGHGLTGPCEDCEMKAREEWESEADDF
jgi:hypothetical protein